MNTKGEQSLSSSLSKRASARQQKSSASKVKRARLLHVDWPLQSMPGAIGSAPSRVHLTHDLRSEHNAMQECIQSR